MQIIGRYSVWCTDVDGKVLWRAEIPNTVVTVGKNSMLDNYLAASSFSNTVYMGLISSASYSAISASDTMASHAGWNEAGGAHSPTYSGTRATASWAGASGGVKSLSAAASFSITGSGTVKGCFMVCGSGASSTIDNTGGTLFSAGTFSGGDQAVVSTNTINVSYSVTLV